VKRCSVAGYLFGVVVNRDLEAIIGKASRVGLENQVILNHPERFQIGCAAGAFPLAAEAGRALEAAAIVSIKQ
jgi:hypothetical protein